VRRRKEERKGKGKWRVREGREIRKKTGDRGRGRGGKGAPQHQLIFA